MTAAAIGAYLVAIVGLDVLLGDARRVSLGQGASVAIGSYTTAILCAHHHLGAPATIPISGAVAGALALVFGYVAHDELPLATLGAAITLPWLLARYVGVVRFDTVHYSNELTWAVAVVLFAVAWAARRSHFGRALRAVRDSERGAAGAGISAGAYRLAAFTFAGAYGGIAGSLLALAAGHVTPTAMTAELSLALLAGAVVGLGSIWGAPVGAVLVQQLHGPHGTLMLGALVVAVVLAVRSTRRL
jgi:branched-chain amino acid transport system permease protein